MEELFEEMQDMPISAPWPLICRLACMALWTGLTFDQLVEQALTEHLERLR